MITLLPDQIEVKNELRAKIKAGYKRPLVVAPCGWGKGTVSGEIIYESVAKGNRVIFLVNRRELVKDMSRRLQALGIYHGVLMGRDSHGMHMQCLIASKDTLKNRLIKIAAPDLVFVDEAHMFTSPADQELFNTLEENGAKCIVFLTATPWLLNGKGMDQICDCIIEGPQVDWLISQGRLARPEIYSTGQPDMSQVHLKSGDFDESETSDIMLNDTLIGDMVAHWKEFASGLRTIGFAVNRRNSEKYAEMFRAAGITSIAVDANTPDKDRRKADGSIELGRDTIWDMLRAKETLVVWSVGIISYGFDIPEVECAIDAAPTLSLSKHLQRIQRPGRKYPGKKVYIILDHAGNSIRRYPDGSNGLPDSPRHWSIKGWKKKRGLSWKEEQAEVNDMPLVCPVFGVNADTFIECKAPKRVLEPGTKECPICGYKFSERSGGRGAGEEIEIDVTGKLEKVEARVYIYPDATGDTQRDSVISIAKERGYKPGWIEHKTKAITAAREEYRQRFQTEPKDHWTAGMLKSMLSQADAQPSLAEAEEQGLTDWLAGK